MLKDVKKQTEIAVFLSAADVLSCLIELSGWANDWRRDWL